jgi:GTP pyrophosphokinase
MPKGLIINETELVDVRKAFNRLMRKMRLSLKEQDRENLNKAYKIAAEAHKYQRRKSGEPYIFHPIEVGRICFEEIGLGPTAVICAILHDVVEDTDVTLQDIEKMFGPKVTKIVDGLTKLDGLYNVDSAQAENFKKVLSTLVEDVRVVLIKMADRLHNMRTISAMPQHTQLKIAAETSYIYTPLAHRLGLYKIKTEFQDICMMIQETELYNEIKLKLDETESQRKKYIREFIRPLKKELDTLEIPYRVIGRPKAISSIANKIKKNDVAFEEIYDLFAVRIIIDVPIENEKRSCWQIYSIITDVFKPIPERLKDWVTTPKGNGYESLHTTVIGPRGRYVEVQIRSERMDEIAERGFAAHWKYKQVKVQDNVFDAWLDNVRDLLEAQHSNALEFINDFKANLFSEELYVYTPNGDMKILPKGATALDFAFHIHSDVGYHAVAIKVNNKLVPMGYMLSNGDQIQVTTSKNQKPNEEWLKMVVTGKARSKIRSSMKEERRKLGEFSKEALERKLKNMKLDFEQNVDFLVNYYGYNSRPDLYYAIYQEEVKLSDLKDFEIEHNKFIRRKKITNHNVSPAPKVSKQKTYETNKSKILVNGEPGDLYEYSFASCCNPVQGDEIFGFVTTSQGLKVHRTNCANANNLLANYGYRVLKTEWDNTQSGSFTVELLIKGVDSGIGVIQMLTNEISTKLGINIRSFSIEGSEGYFEGKVGIFVKNIDQLNMALNSIRKLEDVHSVDRLDTSN